MRILITGVNGFVGKSLYKTLAEKNQVFGIYNSGIALFDNCIKIDLSNEEEASIVIEKAGIEKIDSIVHLASRTANASNLNDLSVLEANASIAKNISFVAKKLEVKHFINLSSSSVYPNIDGIYSEESIPNPSLNSDCIYGLSKLNSEVIINYFLSKSDIKITHLRTTMIHGEGMDNTRIIPIIEKEIAENNSVTLFGMGERLLNLISVEKLTEHISFFIKNPSNVVVNVGEECISLLDLAKRIIAEKGNSNTEIIFKEVGNRGKFILDIQKLNKITANV